MFSIVIILFIIYTYRIVKRVLASNHKRRHLSAGDTCKVYIGENKLPAFVLYVNSFVEVWVAGRVARFDKTQIYA